MLTRRLYYLFKPYLPRRIRMSMRRIVARRKRVESASIWPINESTGIAPAGWAGWPHNKKFAVVLTHDVEGPDGVAKCRQLAELEMELGFRSSFNFIPEGPYRVTPELRSWLISNGFEVGVHDLNHDGHLYSSQQGFARKAVKINEYLREWGAVGFRAGFMLRNLDWVHHLNIRYDASTFDTDPFEPQPDAAGTIFPFWIKAPAKDTSLLNEPQFPTNPANDRSGYAELPYTLPQDSTLFLVLEERTNEIWREKADWISQRGGMVLVNVHPDYLEVKAPGVKETLTVRDHYRDLLRYLKNTYGQTFWPALPREVADYVHSLNRSSILKTTNSR